MSTRPASIRFGREICGDLTQAERREWWLANGLGGYAAGTVAGTLTRRYHGLLVAPLQPPLGRSLVFAKADAWLDWRGTSYPLFGNRWPDGVIHPEGFRHIEHFWLDGRMPVWVFAFGAFRLEVRIWLEPGAHTVYLAYRPSGIEFTEGEAALRIKLLVNARDHHGNTDPWRFNPVIEPDPAGGLSVRNPPGSGSAPYRLRFQTRGGDIRPEHVWYENFDLSVETERGLASRDHHLCVGECRLRLSPRDWTGLVATLEAEASPYLEESMRRFFAHDEGVLRRAQVANPELSEAPGWVRQLTLAADSFLFARQTNGGEPSESVIAGYPWFGDWGRDTMIALPGLTLVTGRHDSARRILETFGRYVDQGMLPNVFPGDGQTPEYNTVDAALWFLEAWRAVFAATGDLAALKEVFPVLEEIVRRYRGGTRYGIRLDPADGLLRCGAPGVQLTWMDAKVGDWVVTPREGKPVEINALWFNGQKVMAQLARALNRPDEDYERGAEQTSRGFQRYVKPGDEGLLDVLDGPEGDDAALRPNQILAVSLPYSPLGPSEQRAVVRVCGQHLLTSFGLRSLSPEQPEYQAYYRGGVLQRDGAYHQGPVWGWLLGHYALAEFRVTGNAELAMSRLEPVRDHLFDAGLGTVSEIFDGAPPHHPRGAPAQAWSVACVLEAWWKLERERERTKTPPDAEALRAEPPVGPARRV